MIRSLPRASRARAKRLEEVNFYEIHPLFLFDRETEPQPSAKNVIVYLSQLMILKSVWHRLAH
jgi:hypothetical protein